MPIRKVVGWAVCAVALELRVVHLSLEIVTLANQNPLRTGNDLLPALPRHRSVRFVLCCGSVPSPLSTNSRLQGRFQTTTDTNDSICPRRGIPSFREFSKKRKSRTYLIFVDQRPNGLHRNEIATAASGSSTWSAACLSNHRQEAVISKDLI